MKRRTLHSGILFSLIGLAAALPPAYAQQPPDVVDSDASGNTASGTGALAHLTAPATRNSAFGYAALYLNSTGSYNTAAGFSALSANTTGYNNTAVGSEALTYNTIGANNIAIGTDALHLNSSGNNNVAVGGDALYSNVGDNNTASGFGALYSNTTGANNTALGVDALFANTTGKGNAAQGVSALRSNTTGIRNLGIGSNALYSNVSGSYNVALGFNAGYNQTTGNDNIYIANPGIAGESQTLRLGAQGTAGVQGSGILSTYIAGVATSQVTGSAVYVTPSGQLGVLASSERFKMDIEDMGTASDKLARLHPVTFKLKTDPRGTRQYGLIAEEVAKVYPELVIHGADGRIDGVRYEELAPMLLNVFQQQQQQLLTQARQADAQAEIINNLSAQAEKAGSQARILRDLQIRAEKAHSQAQSIRSLQVQAEKADAQAEVIRKLQAQVAQLNEFKQSLLPARGEPPPRLLARAP